jgi:hypothetical protein
MVFIMPQVAQYEFSGRELDASCSRILRRVAIRQLRPIAPAAGLSFGCPSCSRMFHPIGKDNMACVPMDPERWSIVP